MQTISAAQRTHTFHIPVMGTGFTIDTPIKVARFGISSVVSLGDDKLIEKIRRHYCDLYGEPYIAIPESDKDHRARRITEYLNLMDRVIRRQIGETLDLPFGEDNELTDYFEVLSDTFPLKRQYRRMLETENESERLFLENRLREQVIAGSVDVNIMTKADRQNTFHGGKLPAEYSDAMAALRGFALSTLNASVVFSAGLNLHLYSYISEFDDFYTEENGQPKKRVTLKVSDFRSASVQAKVLAKKGIWVSEYRVESGLNCGGHAFPTAGHLLGPILEEFKAGRADLVRSLFPLYQAALLEKGRTAPAEPYPVQFTAQGGVGTAAEHDFLLRNFRLDSVGWGSPFLLVPEATAVDEETLQRLAAADGRDIYLSHASPLGVPFYNLHSSASERVRRERIEAGKPGSPCLSRYLAFSTEFGEPALCVSSSQYQEKKLKALDGLGLDEAELAHQKKRVTEKACICRNLGDGALLKYGILDEKKVQTPAVCPGPNLAFFSRVFSLKEMIGHIYGARDILNHAIPRPHFFINELRLYIDHFKGLVAEAAAKVSKKEIDYLNEFKANLLAGIEYYRSHVNDLQEETRFSRQVFIADLLTLKGELGRLALPQADLPGPNVPDPLKRLIRYYI